MTLKNLTAIVTGGCSGLGHATAIALRKAGANVSLFDLNEELGATRVEELGSDNTLFTKVDVRDEASVQDAIDATTHKFGAISLVVNCAGIAPAKRLLDKEGNPAPLGDFQKTIDINLVGSFNVSRLVAAAMAKQAPINDEGERGLIVNTASVAGYEGQIGQTAYAASKGGIIGLVRSNIKGLPHYLVDAKYEPGNYNQIQISPSLQATYSNLNRVHLGLKPKVVKKYFSKNYKTIRKFWVTEDGGRLYLKRNLHWIIQYNGKIDLPIYLNFYDIMMLVAKKEL